MAPRPSEETNEPAGSTLSSRITNMTGGKLISERNLENVLSGRLGKVGYGEGSTEDGTVRTRDISEVIIDSLPKELRTQEVIQAIDLRPYLVALIGKTIVQRTDGRGTQAQHLGQHVVGVRAQQRRRRCLLAVFAGHAHR